MWNITRIMKTVTFLGCLSGCLYQCINFLVIFYRHPLSGAQVRRQDRFIIMPAVTVCECFGVPRIFFCAKFPERCEEPQNITKFCQENSWYCKLMESSYPNQSNPYLFLIDLRILNEVLSQSGTLFQFPKDYDRQEPHIPRKTFRELSKVKINGTLHIANKNYMFGATRNYPSIQIISKDWEGNRRSCFLLGYDFSSNQRTIYRVDLRRSVIGMEWSVSLVMDHNVLQYHNVNATAEARIALHFPRQFINPFQEGFDIRPGHAYYVFLKVVINELMPFPYPSDCIDYFALWLKSKKKNGPLSQKTCLTRCYMEKSLALCNCVPGFVFYPHDEEECEDDYACVQNIDTTECYQRCKRACRSLDITYKVFSQKLGSYQWMKISPSKRISTDIKIQFSTRDIFYNIYKAKYEGIEVFGYIGGYIGVWIGCSIISGGKLLEMKISNYWISTPLK